ncbi:MAG TPA: lysophospholipase [Myxococcaceae bacterium]|nr:lysophospholipase [Myxococcaceae bacterium]
MIPTVGPLRGPFPMNHHQEGHLAAPDGTRLWFERDVPDGARAHVVLVHGYGDHLGRYRTFRDAMLSERLAVHAYDVRGHGRSEGVRGAVRAFSDYTAELEAFLRSTHALAAGLPLFIVAHSHGGLITLRWLADGGADAARTLGLRGLVLSAPYLSLAFTPPAWKTAPAVLLSRLLPSLPIPTGIASTDLSRDPAWQRATDEDVLYGRKATPRWYTEHTRTQAEVLASATRLRIPVLLMLPGDDRVASAAVSRRWFETLTTPDKRLREWPSMRHEIFNEIGKEDVYAETSRWISEHL